MSAVQFPDYRKAPKQMEDNDSGKKNNWKLPCHLK